MAALDALELVVGLLALVGAVYSVARIELSLRLESRAVKEELGEEIDELGLKLDGRIRDLAHDLALHKEKFRSHRANIKYLLSQLNLKLNEQRNYTQIKLRDLHGFLRKHGFSDRPTVVPKDED